MHSTWILFGFLLMSLILSIKGYPITCGYCRFKTRSAGYQPCRVINYGQGCQNPSALPRASEWPGAPRDLAVTFHKHRHRFLMRISFKPPDASISALKGVMVAIIATSGRDLGQLVTCLVYNLSRVDWNQVGRQTDIELYLTPRNSNGCHNLPFVWFKPGESFYINVESLPARAAYHPNQGSNSVEKYFRIPPKANMTDLAVL
ncbi:uncharacterized protein LOC135502529 [Lineus longissimus]|uniref:uncharacterized protein LOC135502316 n=1 Tax=Lineus longissimus TaxID=88925 RepID=UPI002B4E5FB0